ncbi:MAG: LysR family transcriptional regulator [Giesbergeria sp.]
MNLFVSFKYLLALDEQRHFGRAALACHVTQPALSNALRALEESLGVAIVTRGRNFAGFTTEGERVLASARRMLREHELLQQELQSSAGSPSGALHIGAVPMCMPVAARFVGMLHERHPGIVCTLRSMSSPELESGLENMVLDMAMGYPERLEGTRAPLRVVPQYTEHYFLLRRAQQPSPTGLQKGPATTWAEAATLPLCLLTSEMHNRTIVDSAFRRAKVMPRPAIETNSILTLALSAAAGRVSSIMPGALVDAVQGYGELEALPLVEPFIEVPIALMVHDSNRLSRTLEAALEFAQGDEWLATAAQHGNLFGSSPPPAPPSGKP